tara:strand:- start:19 stop:873 length:855 start_codon:yes stop_codon:yes gene_type:complete
VRLLIDLNDYRKNIYHNYGVKECPHYSEDGVIEKIFTEIGLEEKPFIVEFGETRSLGTTTRAFRIGYSSRAMYFVGSIDFYSKILNILDVLKATLLTRNIKCLKFLMNMPFMFFVKPENIVDLFDKILAKEGINHNNIDILTIDIDSYDYYIVKELLEHEYKPRLFIVEYNPNLPIDQALSYPNVEALSQSNNRKVYGASYLAMDNLIEKFGYELVHISGFCNLFYIRNENSGLFTKPDINKERPVSKKEVIKFVDLYCQKDFRPSWFDEPDLNEKELKFFDKV